MNSSDANQPPLVSVVVVNYNCKNWLDRFFQSLRAQTIFDRVEVVIVDNTSSDGSAEICEKEMTSWPNGVFLQTGGNYGFGGGSNRGAKIARGKYLYFLNPDVWLEHDCLQRLVEAVERSGCGVAGVVVLDYDSDNLQSKGVVGFDIFGLSVNPRKFDNPKRLFCVGGFYFIRTELFLKIGGWDDEFFLYGEEMDLAWRIWISGENIVAAPAARIHHRGAAAANPKGGVRIIEIRTNDTKRFYACRNHLLTLLKVCRHIMLLVLVPAVVLVLLEGLAGVVLLRRWSFFSKSSWAALTDCWRLRGHWMAERRRIRSFRKRGDFWMMRFFSLRLNRWSELKKIFKLGLPKVEQR